MSNCKVCGLGLVASEEEEGICYSCKYKSESERNTLISKAKKAKGRVAEEKQQPSKDEPLNKDKSYLDKKEESVKKSEIVITDIRIPFWSMVVLMVKWAIASIPALIILFVLTIVFGSLFGGLLVGIVGSR